MHDLNTAVAKWLHRMDWALQQRSIVDVRYNADRSVDVLNHYTTIEGFLDGRDIQEEIKNMLALDRLRRCKRRVA